MKEVQTVKVGDWVTHNDGIVNGGMTMEVQAVREIYGETQVKLEYLHPNTQFKVGWFNLADCNVYPSKS
jgi:hypothetical protein